LPAWNFKHYVDHFEKGPDKILPELDVFHTSSYDLTGPKKAKKFIVTVHDVIIKAYPHGHDEKTIKEIDGQLKRILGEADILITDSCNTKSDLMKFYQISDSKIKVIYPGVVTSRFIRHQSWRRSREPYILFVGTIEPRKNIQGLIKAFNLLKKEYRIGHKLIIAGMKGWMYDDIFKEYENSEFKDKIIFKGYVPDEELTGLYQNASVFVYPSFYEGFGLPILEAFSHGVPVIASSTTSCGEIAEGSALLINPENYKEIGEAILKIINNDTLKEELTAKGIDKAREFSWQKTAKGFLNLVC
jgi:glycosyltransferase involved in cell wall biosynthesis